jgi:hypothetical protein
MQCCLVGAEFPAREMTIYPRAMQIERLPTFPSTQTGASFRLNSSNSYSYSAQDQGKWEDWRNEKPKKEQEQWRYKVVSIQAKEGNAISP